MFGAGAILAKIVAGSLSPLFIIFLDLSLGFILLFPFLLFTHTPLFAGVKKEHLPDLLLASLIGTALALFLVVWGLKLTTGIRGGMWIQFQTVAGILFAMGILREKISKRAAIGIFLMLLGGAFIVVRMVSQPLWQGINMGDIAVLLGAIGFGYTFTPLRRLASSIEPLQLASLRLLIGAIALTPFLAVFPSTIPEVIPSAYILSILVIYVVTNFSLAFFTVQKALKLLPAWKTAVVLQTMPIFSTISAIVLLNESLTILQGIGAAFIIGGGILIVYIRNAV